MALPAHAVFALSGLGSAWAVGAAAASRGFGGAPLPESLRGPEPPGLLTGFPGRALRVKRSGLSIFISVRTASKRRLLKLQQVSYRLSRAIRCFMDGEVLTGCFSAGRDYDLVSEIEKKKGSDRTDDAI